MKKIKKYKNSKLSQIDNEDFNYSHIGDASAKKFLYLLDKKKNIFKKKKQSKENPQELLIENKDIYDDIYQKDEYEDDIFDKAYDAKHKKELKEKRQKYELPKNSCAYIDDIRKVEQKIKSEISQSKKITKKLKEEVKYQKSEVERQLTSELNKERYKYHLIHHHHDLFVDKSNTNLNDQVSSNSYKPKLEFIFKKIIYSPEFNKMSGRYDKEEKTEKIEDKKETILKTQKEKELENYQKKIKKIKNLKLIPATKSEETENETQEKKQLILKRSNSITNNLIPNKNIIFRRNSLENGEYGTESRNFTKKIIRRNNSVLMNPKFLIFNIRSNQSKKNSIASIGNIEEEYTENNDITNEKKRNISHLLDENTLSSVNHNKTTSGKKKHSNNETEVIYPNLSKNESNIIINNNYNLSYRKSLGGQKGYNTLNNLNFILNQKINEQNFGNIPSKEFNILKKYRFNTIISSLNRDILPTNKVVNFEKMLPRYHNNKSKEQDKNIYSSLSPNYDAIRPKCIMKVIYAQKHYKKNKTKEFKSDFNELVFDINKSYNNYNNHFPTKNIYLGKMTGRKVDKTLPSYMLDQFNRNAFNTFNEKSLKLNNFANGELLEQKSSFNQKRTFNYKLNGQYTGNDANGLDNDLNTLFRKVTKYPINNKNYSYAEFKALSCSIRDSNNKNRYDNFINPTLTRAKMPEYYQVNLDKFGKYPFSCGEKIDGFTLKTIKSSKSAINLLTAHEKKIFLSKLDE